MGFQIHVCYSIQLLPFIVHFEILNDITYFSPKRDIDPLPSLSFWLFHDVFLCVFYIYKQVNYLHTLYLENAKKKRMQELIPQKETKRQKGEFSTEHYSEKDLLRISLQSEVKFCHSAVT